VLSQSLTTDRTARAPAKAGPPTGAAGTGKPRSHWSLRRAYGSSTGDEDEGEHGDSACEREHIRADEAVLDAGELTGATRPWQFGDTEPWHISRTLTNAVLRQAGTATPGAQSTSINITVDDVEVSENEKRAQAAVEVLVDN
jgi:uncharacterized protein with von Willebrand factor type A (vWA) domain